MAPEDPLDQEYGLGLLSIQLTTLCPVPGGGWMVKLWYHAWGAWGCTYASSDLLTGLTPPFFGLALFQWELVVSKLLYIVF